MAINPLGINTTAFPSNTPTIGNTSPVLTPTPSPVPNPTTLLTTTGASSLGSQTNIMQVMVMLLSALMQMIGGSGSNAFSTSLPNGVGVVSKSVTAPAVGGDGDGADGVDGDGNPNDGLVDGDGNPNDGIDGGDGDGQDGMGNNTGGKA